jgi:hypothetical protein
MQWTAQAESDTEGATFKTRLWAASHLGWKGAAPVLALTFLRFVDVRSAARRACVAAMGVLLGCTLVFDVIANQPPTGSAKDHESLTGTIIRKAVNRDDEGWNATGWDGTCRDMAITSYLVLDTGTDQPRQRSATEGVLLVGESGGTHGLLDANVGRRVRIYGDYIRGNNCARGTGGKIQQRGVYFRVLAVERL